MSDGLCRGDCCGFDDGGDCDCDCRCGCCGGGDDPCSPGFAAKGFNTTGVKGLDTKGFDTKGFDTDTVVRVDVVVALEDLDRNGFNIWVVVRLSGARVGAAVGGSTGAFAADEVIPNSPHTASLHKGVGTMDDCGGDDMG